MVKITDLPLLDDMDGTEQVVAVHEGVTKRSPIWAITARARLYTDEVGATKMGEFAFELPGGDTEMVWNAATRRIRSVADPVAANDAATKSYTDIVAAAKMGEFAFALPGGGTEMVWNAALRRIRSLADPAADNDAATASYVNVSANQVLRLARDEMHRDFTIASSAAPIVVAGQPNPTGAAVSWTVGRLMWGIGIAPIEAFAFDSIAFEVNGIGNADGSAMRVAEFRLRIFDRPGGEGDGNDQPGNFILPGNGANDRKLLDRRYDSRSVIAQPCHAYFFVTCRFDLSTINLIMRDMSRFYFAVLSAYDAAGNLISIGMRTATLTTMPDGNSDWRCGFCSNVTDDLTQAEPIAAPTSIAYRLYGRSREADGARGFAAPMRIVQDGIGLSSTGMSIEVPAIRLPMPGLERIVGGSMIELAPLPRQPANDTVTLLANVPTRLSYRYAEAAPIVRRGATVLTRDVHYQYDPQRGFLTGIPNSGFDGSGGTSPTIVTAEYVGIAYRYDSIYAVPETGNFAAVAGAPRPVLAEEFAAAPPATMKEMFKARVSPLGIELLPTHRADLSRRFLLGEEARLWAWVERNRRAMRRTIAKAMRGLPIRIACYGDSITGFGYNLPEQNLSPNGPARDIDAYLESYPYDFRAALPHFDGDGGVGQHVHVGPMWALKAALETWGSVVTYDNWGVGGTHSGKGVLVNPNGDGNDYLHMGHPDRIAALLDPARLLPDIANARPDLVMLASGQNEFVVEATDNNLIDIGQQILGAGCELVISAPTRPSLYHQFANIEGYAYTCEQERRAADYLKCGFVPTHEMFARCEAFGISQQDLSAATGGNHPGVLELHLLGLLYTAPVPLH